MKKLIIIAITLMFLLGFSGIGNAGVSIGINIPIPPLFVFPAPPELAVIPWTYAYYCPDVNLDIFFYGGYWYRPYEGYWYRSASYGGPWAYIESAPSVLLDLPPDYRIITRGERRIPYAEVHRNWRGWERDRYWEHHSWGRMENERHSGLAPSFGERGHGGHGGYGGEVHGRGGSHGGHEGHERR